jgi:hypothetical protein
VFQEKKSVETERFDDEGDFIPSQLLIFKNLLW